MDKTRVITDYDKLSNEIKEQIKITYPEGFSQNLIIFKNKEGQNKKALRFETDEKIYLVRMDEVKAEQIIEDDDDYDKDGNLIEDVQEEYMDKYSDLEYIGDD